MINPRILKDRMNDALEKIDSGEELSNDEIKELLFDSIRLCDNMIDKNRETAKVNDSLIRILGGLDRIDKSLDNLE